MVQTSLLLLSCCNSIIFQHQDSNVSFLSKTLVCWIFDNALVCQFWFCSLGGGKKAWVGGLGASMCIWQEYGIWKALNIQTAYMWLKLAVCTIERFWSFFQATFCYAEHLDILGISLWDFGAGECLGIQIYHDFFFEAISSSYWSEKITIK